MKKNMVMKGSYRRRIMSERFERKPRWIWRMKDTSIRATTMARTKEQSQPHFWWDDFLWEVTRRTTMKMLQRNRTSADNCVYQRHENGSILIVAIYVDGPIILSNNIKEINALKAELNKRFDMKDLGEIHYCLRLQATRDRENGRFRSHKRNVSRKSSNVSIWVIASQSGRQWT